MSKLVVSRKSWHYRLYNFTQNILHMPGLVFRWADETSIFFIRKRYTPTDLCRYFWSIVLGLLVAPIILLVNITMGLLLLACCIIIAPLALIFLLVVFSVEWLNDRRIARKRDKRDSNRDEKFNPITEYIRARKAKVCPLIEVKD
jgi:choline-glycine betaine transporter